MTIRSEKLNFRYGFGPTFLLEFTDPLFEQIGSSFINEYQSEFGASDHLYNCDTFNEMVPETNDTIYLEKSGKAIYQAMATADPEAVWVMQGWIFYFEVSCSTFVSSIILQS